MKNYIQNGDNLTLPAPYALTSGQGAKILNLFGVASGDAALGDPVDLVTVGVFSLPKVNTQVLAIGEPVYWDDSAKVVTKTVASNLKIGVAVAPAANPSGFAEIKLAA